MSQNTSSLSNARLDFIAPRGTARTRIIKDDAEALEIAATVALRIAPGAAKRDQERLLPYNEIEMMSDEGLFGITVPKEYGGPEVKAGTVSRVIALLSGADGSIGQIPQNHFFMLEALRLLGSDDQKRFFYNRVLGGERFFNAVAERSGKTADDHTTTLLSGDNRYELNGRKFYSTGVLFANWIAVVANDDDGKSALAFVPRADVGVTLLDDWTGFGQRTTGSGTTILKNVAVDAFQILQFERLFETPTSMGPFAQIMHAAVEQGTADAALAETVNFIRTKSRPSKDSGVEKASLDPYTITMIGEMKIRADASSAMLDRAARFVDVARSSPSKDSVAAASIAVAEAKVATTEAALFVSSKMIELGGSSATLSEHGLDRYWRNARTHTVHDPVRWKYKFIGDYWLNGIAPPRSGAI